MQYRKFGNTGLEVSALGFGMMRLPLLDGNQGAALVGGDQVDEQVSIANLRYAIDHGVNYVDTAYNYLNGNSERITGKALQDGYRDKVYLATKLPVWLLNSEEDFDRLLNEQLQRLGTDHIDFYLVHAMKTAVYEDKFLKYRVADSLKRAKEDGRIRYMGFSYHDNVQLFKTIVDYTDWDFCQIQLNYLDTEFQAGLEGLRYASEKGLAVTIMEPLRGGYLANVPASVKEVCQKCGKTHIELAFNFLWDMPEVSLILSGMGSMEQVIENLGYAEKAEVGMMTEEDKQTVQTMKTQINSISTVACTGCNYCAICSKRIAIPHIFKAYNLWNQGEKAEAKAYYNQEVPKHGAKADECIVCHRCEKLCPQQIKISGWMSKIHQTLAE